MPETTTQNASKQALLRFWIAPGKTVQSLIQAEKGGRLACLFAVMLGIAMATPLMYKEGDEGPVTIDYALLPTVGIAGFVGGLVGLFLFTWLYRNFSRMLKGQGTLEGVRVGLGWGLLPLAAISTILTLTYLWIAPHAFEYVDGEILTRTGYDHILGPLSILSIIGFIYSYTCLLLSLAAAVKLKILKAFFAFLITVAVSFFPITLLLQLITGRV